MKKFSEEEIKYYKERLKEIEDEPDMADSISLLARFANEFSKRMKQK